MRPVILLLVERIEVPCKPRYGRSLSYRWTNGYYVCDSSGGKIYPPVVRKEAYKLAREIGGPHCKIVFDNAKGKK